MTRAELIQQCRNAEIQRDELAEVLRYYADEENYEGISMDSFAPIEGDKGRRARAILAKLK